MSRAGRSAADLIRAVGLLPDGPAPWGRAAGGRGPGIYVVELPNPPASAPIDLGRVGAWLVNAPGLKIDGSRPTGKELAARLSGFWLPGEPVLFAGATEVSIGGRVAAMVRHVSGDRKPHAEAQWLQILFGLAAARVWWASTTAPNEALDVLLTAFADGLDPAARKALPDPEVVLPFAVTRRPTGERKRHGITGAVPHAEPGAPPVTGRLTELPPADADGVEETDGGPGMTRHAVAPPAGRSPRRHPDDGSDPVRPATPLTPALRRTAAAGAGRATASRARTAGAAATSRAATPRATTSRARAGSSRAIPPTAVTADGLARLHLEHEELTKEKRPAVIARIRTAKEHGDLKENAEYHSAREEQSFLEGRILAIEAILRNHVVIELPAAGGLAVHLGSTVTIEDTFGQTTYTIVGSTEAKPTEGRISSSSPVGAALLGRAVGDDVAVRTPRGETHYRVVAIE